MICQNCGHENEQENNFCEQCGTKLVKVDQSITIKDSTTPISNDVHSLADAKQLANPEQPVEEVPDQLSNAEEVQQENGVDTPLTDEQASVAEQEPQQEEDIPIINENEEDIPIVNENEEPEPLKKPFRLKKRYFVTFGIALLFATLMLFFTLWESSDKIRSIQQVSADEKVNEQELEAIYMQSNEMTIYPNRMQRVQYYVYPEQANTKHLVWESSNPAITINPAGYVTSSQENISGELTLRNDDGSIKATTIVHVGEQEDSFYKTVDYINNEMTDGESILDYNKEHFFVGKEHDSTNIEENVIQHLTDVEEKINQYTIRQKQFKNKATNNLVDVDVYVEPSTNEIRKIVAIEHMENQQLNITDFYYNNGSLFFYFNRTENYYRPVAARQDFEGVRAYFYNDALIRYRDIIQVANGFEKTDYTLDDETLDWKVYEYKNIDKDDVNKEKTDYKKPQDDKDTAAERQTQYLEDEQTIVNAAYNIYRAVIEQPDVMKVSGYIAYPNNGSAENIPVKIFSEKFQLLMGETLTDSTGYYEFFVPMNQGNYRIYTHNPNYVTTTIYGIDSGQGISNAIQETIYLFEPNSNQYRVYLDLVDAISGTVLAEQIYGNSYDTDYDSDLDPVYVQVYVREGINNKSGTVIHSEEVNLRDFSQIEMMLSPGNYTVEIVVNGYENNYLTLSTIEDEMKLQSNIVPQIEGDEVRIVLTWSHTPNDLDSHLFFPNGQHIAYYQQNVGNNFLDTDDTSGYGPETITINDLGNGTYKYYVADFSNLSSDQYNSNELSNSFARVDIYSKSGLTSFTVPRNQHAVIWQVFNISNGKIVPIQRMYSNVEDYDWWTASKD